MSGRWWEAEKFEDCAITDMKGMYNHYILNKGHDWCLTADFEGFKGKGTRLNNAYYLFLYLYME